MATCENWERILSSSPNDADAKSSRNLCISHIRGKIGRELVVEQARCIFLRKRGIGIEPKGEAQPGIGILSGHAAALAIGYSNGHHTAEVVWQALSRYAQAVARMIADREGRARPPAALRMMIPDCEINRTTAIPKEMA